jgi:hypothetical protein
MVQKRGQKTPGRSREEDAETLAAIQRGIRDSEEGRVTSLEDVRKSIIEWRGARRLFPLITGRPAAGFWGRWWCRPSAAQSGRLLR